MTTLSPDPARRTRSPPDRPEPSTARPPDRRRHWWRPEPAAEPPPPPDRPPGTAPGRDGTGSTSSSRRAREGVPDTARHPWPTAAVQGPVRRLAPEPGHGPRIGAVEDHRGDRAGVPVELPRLQHSEQVALRVGQDRPRHVALAYVGGRRTELLQARDQLRLMGRGRGGEIEVHAVLHRLGVRDADDIDADGGGVRPDEAHGFDVGHPWPLAGHPPAERIRPEPAERRVIAGLHIHLNKAHRHPLTLYLSGRTP